MKDPWTGKWERLRIPKEQAGCQRRRELTPKPSYWGEKETREWRRKLREEKGERERRERLEWRVREYQIRGYPEESGRRTPARGNQPGWSSRTRTPSPYWRGKLDRY